MTEPSILVIDDDPAILDTLSDILVEEGYRVTTAQNGAEGLTAIDRALPQLVLLDMRMPVLDGWGFALMLRQRGLRLPIVVMTAAQDARQWAQEIAADHYLAKPFDVDELLKIVEQIIAAQ
jgi:CheY-like chemotaxis protein